MLRFYRTSGYAIKPHLLAFCALHLDNAMKDAEVLEFVLYVFSYTICLTYLLVMNAHMGGKGRDTVPY